MRTRFDIILAALFLAAACAGELSSDDVVGDSAPSGETSGGEDNTFDHPSNLDVWALLERLAEEGPPRYSARVHACAKMRFATVGRVLASFGVDLAGPVGDAWRASEASLGAPDYAARQRENHELTMASASRLFDLFASAAPEIIAAAETAPGCGTPIFDASGRCARDGLTCLLGLPAEDAHLAVCDEIVARASSPELGRTIAVAAIAAAGHTCE
jgi:hypothetical protein